MARLLVADDTGRPVVELSADEVEGWWSGACTEHQEWALYERSRSTLEDAVQDAGLHVDRHH